MRALELQQEQQGKHSWEASQQELQQQMAGLQKQLEERKEKERQAAINFDASKAGNVYHPDAAQLAVNGVVQVPPQPTGAASNSVRACI
jgi:hypothetical protein